MPLPDIFFVFDRTEGEFTTYPIEAEAQAAYDKRIKQINDDVKEIFGEYDGDEQVFMGTVTKRAEVVPVDIDRTTGDELFALCSYAVGGA